MRLRELWWFYNDLEWSSIIASKALKPVDKLDQGFGSVYQKELLILTNNDALEKIEELVEALPNFLFHIAAYSDMSERLIGLLTHENVRLHRLVLPILLKRLVASCDLYLDINYDVMESLPETAYISVKILIGNRCIQCIRSVGYLRSQRKQPLITIVVPTHDDKAFPLLVKFLQNFLVGIGHSSVYFLLRKRHRSDHFQENIAEMMIEFLLYFFDFLQRFFWKNTYKIPPYYSLAIANNSINEKAKPIR